MDKKAEFVIYVLTTVAVFALAMLIASFSYGDSVSNLLLIGLAAFFSPVVGIPAANALMRSRIRRGE